MGGTFDPVHLGHLLIAEEARVALGLDGVLFIPAGQPYFKTSQSVSKACHRLAMVELAVDSNPYFTTSGLEIRRSGPTYTVDTLTELRKRFGEDRDLFLIMGMDALADLAIWRRAEDVLAMSIVVGFARPGVNAPDKETLKRIQILNRPLVDISASDIRRRVREGLSIRHMVPDQVAEYIFRHRLYKGSVGTGEETI